MVNQYEFPTFKESTVREFRKKHEKFLKENKDKLPGRALKLGRPLMLGNADEKVNHKDTMKIQFSNSPWTVL